MKTFLKNFMLFCIGFTVYMCIEGVWKTFVSGSAQSFFMGLLGGLVFLTCGFINKLFTWEMPLVVQTLIGTIITLILEFGTGLILNVWLKLGIWDYSDLPMNIMGQISLPFTFVWVILVLACIFVDDYLRWIMYGEEKPHYHFLIKGNHVTKN